MKKKIRKPRNFGIENEVTGIGFAVDKIEGTIEFLGGPSEPDKLWMSPRSARWLASQLNKAADYLEQEGVSGG